MPLCSYRVVLTGRPGPVQLVLCRLIFLQPCRWWMGLPVPAPVSADPPNVPVRLCSLLLTTGSWPGGIALWGSRACVSCVVSSHLHTSGVRQASSPSHLRVACNGGKSHRSAMRPVRTSTDPIAASRGDCVTLDIKSSNKPGFDNLKCTAVLACCQKGLVQCEAPIVVHGIHCASC